MPAALARPSMRLAPPDYAALERRLLFVAVALGVATFWLSPRLPMVDLPQHAGQVAIWRDLLNGSSPFASEVRINLLTPYLIGYGLALPVSWLVGVTEALRIILAGAFVAFVAAARGLRRDLGGDPRVDWLFFFGFFGVAWSWGFYTFLVAAPVTLGTLRLALRFDATPTLREGAALTGAGLALLFCHGLQFLLVLALGGAIALERALRLARGWRERFAILLARLGPYLALAAAFLALMIARRLLYGADASGPVVFGTPIWLRPFETLALMGGAGFDAPLMLCALIALLAPLAMGLVPRRGPGLAMALTAAAIQLFCVSTALDTGFLHERFALYVAPFWALCLRPSTERPQARRAHVALIAAAFAALGWHAWRVAQFGLRDRAFATIVAAARPGERVMSLIFEAGDGSPVNRFVYLQWGAWLQGERGAFVDFNFAYFPPQIVRFRPGKVPPMSENEGSFAKDFDWKSWGAERYDAFLAHGAPNDQRSVLLDKAPCPLAVAAVAGDWALYRKAACAPAKPTTR